MIARRISLLSLVCLTVISFHIAAGQQAHTLKYKFEKGKVYKYTDSVLVNSTQEMMGQEMKVASNVYSVTRAEVVDVKADGGCVLMISSDSMRISMKSPRGDTTMTLTDMIGKRTRVTMNVAGDVVRRETVDSVKLGGMGRGVPQRELFRTHTLPAKSLMMGEKWNAKRSDTTEAMGGKNVSTSTIEYTLAGAEKFGGRECLKITYAGKVAITGKGSMQGMDVFTEGTGTMSGTFFFDENGGLLVADNGKFNNEMTAAVTGAQNMTIPISQVGTMRHILITK
jgi:hypothetical protein